LNAKPKPKKPSTLNEAQKLFYAATKANPDLWWARTVDPSLATAENLWNPYPPKEGECPIILPYRDGMFRAQESDPPWDYKDRKWNGMDTVQEYRVHPTYNVMSLHAIWAMGAEHRRLASPQGCHLWMFTTKDFYLASRAMIEAWGFTYKQEFPWIKTTQGLNRGHVGLEGFTQAQLDTASEVMATWGQPGKPAYGMGRWGRNSWEVLILATSTNSLKLLRATTEPNIIFAPTGDHSEKPEAAYDLIRRNSIGPRLSCFCRDKRKGFVCWGNEVRAVNQARELI
jgi:N6-adenosine-specific RNA methylase IME4